MKDEQFTTPKEKVEAYRAVYQLTMQSLEKGVNLRKEMIQMDTMKEGKVRLGAFESFVQKVDQGFPKTSMASLEKCFASEQAGGFTFVEYTRLQTVMDEVLRALDQLREFFAHIDTTITTKGTSIDDYLKLADQNKVLSIRFEDFEKMLLDNSIKSIAKEVALMFMILNEFEADNRVGFDQFKRIMSQELTKYKATRGLPQSGSAPKLATSVEAEAVKPLTNMLQGIKRGLTRIQGGKASFEGYLSTKFKPANQTVSVKEFEAAVRQIHPSTPYMELESLIKLCITPTEASRVPVEKLDSLLKLSSLQIRSSQTNKESDEISKNQQLFKVLEEIGKFAVRKGVAVSEWFSAMDTEKTGKLSRTVFENCLHDAEVMITKPEKEQFFVRYRPATAKPGEDAIDYKKFEIEVGIVYPLYAGMIGDTEIKVRDTQVVLEDILRYIFEKYPSITDWAKDNCRGKPYMNMGDLKLAFAKLQPALTVNDLEFQKIYITLNPTKAERIMFYKLEECMMSMVRPIVVEISGKILNGFDKSREPLGLKVNASKAVKKGWIPIPALANIIKQYDEQIMDNSIWLIVSFLDLALNNIDNVKYQEFCTSYLHFLNTKTHLRRPEEVQLFFSSIPPEGHSLVMSDTTKIDGTKSPPGEVVPSKMMDTLRPYVMAIKQKYALLTTEDISTLFTKLDSDKSGTISKEEFEAAIKHKMPAIPPKLVGEIYKHCDKDHTGNVKCPGFIEFLTKTFPEFENKHDLLVEKTAPYRPYYVAIGKGLVALKTAFRDLFEVTHIKLQVALDTIQMKLQVPNTEDRLRMLLGHFVPDSSKGTLDVDEFQAVLSEYADKTPDPKNLSKEGEATDMDGKSPVKSKAKPLSAEELQLQELIELLRKFVKKHPSFSVHTFFKYLDTQGGANGQGNDGKLTKNELKAFLKKLKEDITEKEVNLLFQRIDTSGDGFINRDELAEFFGLKVLMKDEAVIQDINTGTKWDAIIAKMKKCLLDHSQSAESFFEYEANKYKMNKKDFEMALKLLGVKSEEFPELNGFMLFMESKVNPAVIDLTKLKMLLDQSSQKQTYGNQESVDIFLCEVLIKFANDPVAATTAFNPDRSDGISFVEFFINTKYYMKQTITEAEARSIFNNLKDPSEAEIRPTSFRFKLMETMSKYQTVVRPAQGQPGVMTPSPSGGIATPAVAPTAQFGFIPPPPNPRVMEVGTFEFHPEGATQSSSSAARLGVVIDDKLTPEQKKKLEKDGLFMRIRHAMQHNDALLLDKLKAQDVKGTNCLNKFYIVDTLKKLGVNLEDKEVELLFDKVVRDKSDPDQIVYLDLVNRIFPNLQVLNITTAADLVAELVRKMNLSKTTFQSLWLDFCMKSEATKEITLDDFRYYLNNTGYLLADERIKDIFSEFDTSRNFKVDRAEFQDKFYGAGNLPTAKKLIGQLKNFLATTGKNCEDTFKPYLDKKNTMNFASFAKALDELKFPIRYLEIEILFAGIHTDLESNMTLEELQKKLDAPVVAPKQEVDAGVLRKAVYRYMREKKLDLQNFFDVMVGKQHGLMSMAVFKTMLETVGLKKLDLDTEVRPLFTFIDKEGDYQISVGEFSQFMDLNTILLLFPAILQFRTEMLNKLVAEKQQAVVYIRKFDTDGDELLDEKELGSLVKSLGLKLTDEEIKLLLQELDVSGDGKISAPEIRRILHIEVIDVILLTNEVQFKLIKTNLSATDAFRQANRDQDTLLNFAEFYRLIKETLDLNFSVIEVDELYSYAVTGEHGKMQLNEFVALFERTRSINPFHYNLKYMESLDEEIRKYYYHKHPNLVGSGKAGGTSQQDLYKRWDQDRLANDKRMIMIEPPIIGDQSMPAGNLAANKNYAKDKSSMVGDLDIKLVSKMDQNMKHRGTLNSYDYFKIIVGTENELDFKRFEATLEELNVRNDLGAPLTEEQKRKIWAKMNPGENDKVNVYSFKTYYDLVSLTMGQDQRNDRSILSYVTKILRTHLIDKQTDLEHLFESFKKPTANALSMPEFVQGLSKVQGAYVAGVGKNDADNTVYGQPEFEQIFKFLDSNRDGQLSFTEFKGCIWEYEEFMARLTLEKQQAVKAKIAQQVPDRINSKTMFEDFKQMDLKLDGKITSHGFIQYLKAKSILKSDEELRLLAKLYENKSGEVEYLDFMRDNKIIDEPKHALYHKELLESKKTTDIDELAGFIEQYCLLKDIPIAEFFTRFDTQRTGQLDLPGFRRLVETVDTGLNFGRSTVENMFEILDSNKSQVITRNEFYALVLKKHYREYLVNQHKVWTDQYKQINKTLREKKIKDLQAVYNAPSGCVEFNAFRKHALMIGLDTSANYYIEMLKAFEDEERPGHVNINVLQKLLDETLKAEPAEGTNNQMMTMLIEEETGAQSAPAVLPIDPNAPRKNRFGDSTMPPALPLMMDPTAKGPGIDKSYYGPGVSGISGPYPGGNRFSNPLLSSGPEALRIPLMGTNWNSAVIPETRKFTSEERSTVMKVLANIVNFLDEDAKQPNQVFGKFDNGKNHQISIREFEGALYDELYIEPDANTELFVEYYKDQSTGRIGLMQLYADLEKYKKAKVNRLKFDLSSVKDQLNNNTLSLMPREKLVSYHPPKVDEILAKKCKQRIEQIKTYFRDCYNLSNQRLFEFLDTNKDGCIVKREFFAKTMDAGFDSFSRDEMNEVFHYIDTNRNDVISLKEFKYHFYERDFLEREALEVRSDLDDELRVLFLKIDEHSTKYVSADQVVKCLNILGYPATPEMIEVEFKEYDYDKDGRMDFREFKRFMSAKMRSTIFRMNNMIDEIRKKFHKVHPTDGQVFDFIQMAAAMASLSPDLTPEEVQACFFEADQEQTGFVEIDDIISLVKRIPDETENPLVANAILKLKKPHVLPLKDLAAVYQDLPRNFCTAFTRLNFLEGKNLPCESLYPRMMSSTLGFSDLYGEYNDARTGLRYPVKPYASKYLRLVTLNLATGIPIPEANRVKREQITAREMRVVLFDRGTHKYVGGTVIFPARWDADYEDRWTFDMGGEEGGASSFWVRAPEEESALCLLFEFVVFLKHKNVELQMSAAWASIDLDNINKAGALELPLFGGMPSLTTQIHSSDIRASRPTFMGKVGKFFSGEVKSELRLKIALKDRVNKFSPQVRTGIDLLPRLIIVPADSVLFWRAYRCFAGRNGYISGSPNSMLPADLAVKTFMRCLNIASLQRRVSAVWNSHAEGRLVPKGGYEPNYDLIIELFSVSMRVLSQTFEAEGFFFNKSDQTLELYSMPEQLQAREGFVADGLVRIREVFQGEALHPGREETTYQKPFTIDEMLDDELVDEMGS